MTTKRQEFLRAIFQKKLAELRALYLDKPTTGACVICGRDIPKKSRRRRYCSKVCARFITEQLNKVDIRHWRNRVARRAKWRCQVCGVHDRETKCEAHHVKPILANGGGGEPFNVENGQYLCRAHHRAAHAKLTIDMKKKTDRIIPVMSA